MNNYSYPLGECQDCVHNRVCKYVEEIITVKEEQLLPLDFDTTSCLEYIPTVDVDDGSFYQEIEREVGKTDQLEKVYEELYNLLDELYNDGQSATEIEMNRQTATLFMPPGVSDMTSIQTHYGVLEVIYNEDIPYGEFHLTIEEG
jgi:hypothetical protein